MSHLKNERGMLFPIAIMVLFFITGGITIYLYGYEAQIITYNSLESYNVHATIKVLKEISNQSN